MVEIRYAKPPEGPIVFPLPVSPGKGKEKSILCALCVSVVNFYLKYSLIQVQT